MTVTKLKELLRHQANTELTLVNEQGEKYYVGEATEVRSHRDSVTFRWRVDGETTNTYPFTYAILHDGNKILTGSAIKPLDPSLNVGTFEFTYN